MDVQEWVSRKDAEAHGEYQYRRGWEDADESRGTALDALLLGLLAGAGLVGTCWALIDAIRG